MTKAYVMNGLVEKVCYPNCIVSIKVLNRALDAVWGPGLPVSLARSQIV